MKRQKDMILKDALHRSVGAQYATGEEWRNNSRKNEEMEPKWKQCPVVDMTGDGSKERHYFADKGLSSQSCGFSSSHVWKWELDYKESWALKNWCFWTEVLEKTLERSLDCKEIQPFNPKGNQSWIFTGRTDAKAETPVLWPPDAKNSLIGKDPDAGEDWRQEEKGTTEDEMIGGDHQLYGHEFE